ncbi:MAG: ATP-binding cassette domain-containing protein [Actinobacteria bacterium]|nr:ATP-binding cassette domain-containing protein [Actinomycetota bacterium]
MTTVRFTDITKRFATTPALSGVTAATGPGITGLLGPNGAGKTTLLRILATVLAPDHGRVEILGLDPGDREERTEIRRRLGYLPQEAGFHPRFTAFEFVDYVAILKELDDRRARHAEVHRVLEVVGLGNVAGKRIKTLSGGMRRRLGLAQALLARPEVLLLDEPTAGLDPEQRLRFRQLVSGEHGRTVVLSTHQTEDVAALCSRVVVMDRGAVRFDGTPAALARVASGRVWIADTEASLGAAVSWRTGDGRVRHVGNAPAGAEIAAPTLEDGYLLLIHQNRTDEEAA